VLGNLPARKGQETNLAISGKELKCKKRNLGKGAEEFTSPPKNRKNNPKDQLSAPFNPRVKRREAGKKSKAGKGLPRTLTGRDE